MTRYISRRDFMKQTGGAAGATLAAKTILVDPPAGYAQNTAVPPSDRIRVGIIGVGEQGAGLLRNAIFHKGVECVAACDLWDGRHTLAREIVGKPIKVTRRYQDLLDDKEIDCIINATPDHWHKQILVDCCKAGKDVYSEKPMSHEASEGFEMIRAAEENKRIVEIGAQSASSWTFNKAKELIAQGAIGDLHTIEASTGRNTPNGAWASWMPPPGLSPENLDWDTWLGKHAQDSVRSHPFCALAKLSGLRDRRGGRPDGSPAHRHAPRRGSYGAASTGACRGRALRL